MLYNVCIHVYDDIFQHGVTLLVKIKCALNTPVLLSFQIIPYLKKKMNNTLLFYKLFYKL